MRLPLLASAVALALAAWAFPLASQEKEAPELPLVGQPAPAFRLNDHTGAGVKVGGESEAWTVLAFYPKAATPG